MSLPCKKRRRDYRAQREANNRPDTMVSAERPGRHGFRGVVGEEGNAQDDEQRRRREEEAERADAPSHVVQDLRVAARYSILA